MYTEPTRRRDRALRLTPATIYYDPNATTAIQNCGSRHSFTLDGQGLFLIPPACSLSFNGAVFRNSDKAEINHHQQQQPTKSLIFSDTAILDNKLDFPEQRESFVTTKESIVGHALLLLLVAVLTLLTEIIHSYALSFKARQAPTNDPEAPPNLERQAQQTQHPVTYRVKTENLNMYPRQSRLLSPIDNDPKWESYA